MSSPLWSIWPRDVGAGSHRAGHALHHAGGERTARGRRRCGRRDRHGPATRPEAHREAHSGRRRPGGRRQGAPCGALVLRCHRWAAGRPDRGDPAAVRGQRRVGGVRRRSVLARRHRQRGRGRRTGSCCRTARLHLDRAQRPVRARAAYRDRRIERLDRADRHVDRGVRRRRGAGRRHPRAGDGHAQRRWRHRSRRLRDRTRPHPLLGALGIGCRCTAVHRRDRCDRHRGGRDVLEHRRRPSRPPGAVVRTGGVARDRAAIGGRPGGGRRWRVDAARPSPPGARRGPTLGSHRRAGVRLLRRSRTPGRRRARDHRSPPWRPRRHGRASVHRRFTRRHHQHVRGQRTRHHAARRLLLRRARCGVGRLRRTGTVDARRRDDDRVTDDDRVQRGRVRAGPHRRSNLQARASHHDRRGGWCGRACSPRRLAARMVDRHPRTRRDHLVHRRRARRCCAPSANAPCTVPMPASSRR